MSGAVVSIVISAGSAAHRLRLSVDSAVAGGEAGDVPFEVVIALADADAPTREVAEALAGPRLRLSPGSAATTRSAAELCWGETVVLMRGGDLLSPHYVAGALGALMSGDNAAPVVARPASCVAYGGSPSICTQQDLADDAAGRARLIFAAPFAPPLVAARSLLLRLPPRPWNLEADWAWTRDSLTEGIRHRVVPEAVYVSWTPQAPVVVDLPPPPAHLADLPPLPAAEPPGDLASDAEVAAVLLARAAHARLAGLEEAARSDKDRLRHTAGELAQLQEALASSVAASVEARRTLEHMQASTSWRMTAPLRALVSRLKSGGGR